MNTYFDLRSESNTTNYYCVLPEILTHVAWAHWPLSLFVCIVQCFLLLHLYSILIKNQFNTVEIIHENIYYA